MWSVADCAMDSRGLRHQAHHEESVNEKRGSQLVRGKKEGEGGSAEDERDQGGLRIST